MKTECLQILSTIAVAIFSSVAIASDTDSSDFDVAPVRNADVAIDQAADKQVKSPSTKSELPADEDLFADIPRPEPKKNVGDLVNAAPKRLPRNLKGAVVDQNSNPLRDAVVTLSIYRSKDEFEKNKSTTEHWTSSTNEQGIYSLFLDEVVIERSDDLVLHVIVDGYIPSVSTIPFNEIRSWKLPKQQLIARRSQRSSIEVDPWVDWEDDTEVFDSEVAATVNGTVVLNGHVIDRFFAYLTARRSEMRKAGKNPSRAGSTSSPEDYEKLRAELVERELATHIQKMILAQHLMARLTPNQRVALERYIDDRFKDEIEKLIREFNVVTAEELEAKLSERRTTLGSIKNRFRHERLSGMCVFLATRRSASPSDRDCLEYYGSHADEFETSGTVDWQQISFPLSSTTNTAEAKELLEPLLNCLNRGESCDRQFAKCANDQRVIHEQWPGTNPGSIANPDLRSKLTTVPLDHWALIIEESVPATSKEKAAQRKPGDAHIQFRNANLAEQRWNVDAKNGVIALNLASAPRFIEMPGGIVMNHIHAVANLALAEDRVVVTMSNGRQVTEAPSPEQGPHVRFVRVSARREAIRMPFQDVHNRIHQILVDTRDRSLRQTLINNVVSTAKVETEYSLPEFAVTADASSAASELPAVKDTASMTDAEFEQAIEAFDCSWRPEPRIDTID